MKKNFVEKYKEKKKKNIFSFILSQMKHIGACVMSFYMKKKK